MTKISPADEGIEAARRDASSSCAESSLLEVGAKAETLSRLITHEINSRMNEAHGAVRIDWSHVGTMAHIHEKLVLIADALGVVDREVG